MSWPSGTGRHGALIIEPELLVPVYVMRYGRANRLAKLAVLQDLPDARFEKGKCYPYVSGYDWTAVELVLAKDLSWTSTVFEPSRALVFSYRGYTVSVPFNEGQSLENLPAASKIVENAWDHNHCNICNGCICKIHGPDAFVSTEGAWICKACYEDYVLPRKVNFAWK